MTPDDIHTARFHKPPTGRRGYDEQAVDDLLDRIEDSLGGQPAIRLEELAAVSFPKPPIGKRGYHKDEVDTFIQRVVSEWPSRSGNQSDENAQP
jgi:DivIVA domain-containing protein